MIIQYLRDSYNLCLEYKKTYCLMIFCFLVDLRPIFVFICNTSRFQIVDIKTSKRQHLTYLSINLYEWKINYEFLLQTRDSKRISYTLKK